MMPNLLVMLSAALVPLVIGFIWYHPKVCGNAWMKAAEMTEEKMKGGKMGLIFFLRFVLSFFLTFGLNSIVVHQYGVFSLVGGDLEALTSGTAAAFLAEYGDNFRTFKHGLLHGIITGIVIALPILGINAMLERKSGKYIAINVGYWAITLGIMGGILCQYA
ncbi:MAG: hypothetical protein ACJAUV_001472 [Flavobacteriales bacterium]|jgi:hypothetical protein